MKRNYIDIIGEQVTFWLANTDLHQRVIDLKDRKLPIRTNTAIQGSIWIIPEKCKPKKPIAHILIRANPSISRVLYSIMKLKVLWLAQS